MKWKYNSILALIRNNRKLNNTNPQQQSQQQQGQKQTTAFKQYVNRIIQTFEN